MEKADFEDDGGVAGEDAPPTPPLVDRPPTPVDAETAAAAEAAKDLGNAAFKDKHFNDAVNHYSDALKLNPHSAVYLSNRAFAHIRLENYGSAVADASAAIKLDPTYIKAYYRRRVCKLAACSFCLSLFA